MSFQAHDQDFDDEHHEYMRGGDLQNQQHQQRRLFRNNNNISDEEAVEANSSSDDDGSSSQASITRTTKLNSETARFAAADDSTTNSATAILSAGSFSPSKIDHHESYEARIHNDDNDEEEEEEISEENDHRDDSRGDDRDEHRLDESLNAQVKEMYDYFKEKAGGGTDEEEGSSLNASATAQENLANIMGDVLRINKAAFKAHNRRDEEDEDVGEEDDHHRHDDEYDKIERSEVIKDRSPEPVNKVSFYDESEEVEHHPNHPDHDHAHDPLDASSGSNNYRRELSNNSNSNSNSYSRENSLLASSMTATATATATAAAAATSELAATRKQLSHEHHSTSPSNKYNLDHEQFELVERFYNSNKSNEVLSNRLLRSLMIEALKARDDVMRASTSDIDRALEAVDRDQDEKITLDEFIELLLLFFSSKHNLAERLETIVNGRFNSNDVTPNDAIDLTSFLNEFYGKSGTDGDLFNTLDLNLSLNPNKLVAQLAPKLDAATFVTWDKKSKA